MKKIFMNTLERICADKRKHIARCKKAVTEATLLSKASRASKPRGFIDALTEKVRSGGIGLIAEVKKASPSRGVIREDFDPAFIAREYESGGASCLSVLTDEPYFCGRDEYLEQARNAVSLPVLRKDFMLDPYQIIEARALGADCILLIMAALNDALAQELEAAALELGMDVLAEVHDKAELERAFRLRTTLIGVNNRDLKTLRVDLSVTERLAPLLAPSHMAVCESGITASNDIARICAAGVRCFLVGESLMRHSDIASATKALLRQG